MTKVVASTCASTSGSSSDLSTGSRSSCGHLRWYSDHIHRDSVTVWLHLPDAFCSSAAVRWAVTDPLPRSRRDRVRAVRPRWREAAGVGLEILVLDTDGRITTDYQFIEG
jgi:hypothetical protein